jgi:hypothetical protein
MAKRWGSAAPSDPGYARDVRSVVNIAPDDRGSSDVDGQTDSPPRLTAAPVTADAIKAWWGQRETMRTAIEDRISVLRSELADAELMLLDLEGK